MYFLASWSDLWWSILKIGTMCLDAGLDYEYKGEEEFQCQVWIFFHLILVLEGTCKEVIGAMPTSSFSLKKKQHRFGD